MKRDYQNKQTNFYIQILHATKKFFHRINLPNISTIKKIKSAITKSFYNKFFLQFDGVTNVLYNIFQ